MHSPPNIADRATVAPADQSSPDSGPSPTAPLRSVTPILTPKPLRTASTKRTALVHPSPSVRSRASSRSSNIAQLEATAEKLSLTSSIDAAIRDLHSELKRSDSRRSSILAASVAASEANAFGAPLSRQVSAATSILETNNAARHGGYSPAAYVMSPNHSLLSNSNNLNRLHSASISRMDSGEPESGSVMRRASVRSNKSVSKPVLKGIAEMEPTTLTAAAMDAADRLEEEPEEEEEAHLRMPPMDDVDLTPHAQPYDSNPTDYWDQAYAEAQRDPLPQQQGEQGPRPGSPAGSTGTFEQAELAFADFDGSHCPPDVEDRFNHKPNPLFNGIDMSAHMPEDSAHGSRSGQLTVRPQSYMDPDTGNQMLYYPARVPVMLNLPQKLSKKPKIAQRNARRSQALNAIPETKHQPTNHQPTNWLPEISPEPLLDPLDSGSNSALASPALLDPLSPHLGNGQLSLGLDSPEESSTQPRPDPRPLNDEARKSRMSVLEHGDKRKSQMANLKNLPPQLRASAFFDLPSSETPAIQLKDGSASATLESILDASAKAPVHVFTDHAFTGQMGADVFAPEKKRKAKRGSAADHLDVKKKSSMFHLRAPSKLSVNRTSVKSGSRNSGEQDDSDDETTRLSGSIDGRRVTDGDQDDSEGSDDEPVFHGQPTTLLAELQMRKHQQRLRTRAPAEAYPNGMHSTLLELDTVAELERKKRKGKKVNLAWETMGADVEEESDDEDLPLGLVMAKKGGATDLAAIQAEMHRPLGLMERRELEENEPLSQRRARLHGHDPGPMRKPKSMMTLGNAWNSSSIGFGQPSPRINNPTPEADEVEGETLGERRRRLRAQEEAENPLPSARGVSMAFSEELLGQLGETFKTDEDPADPKGKGKEKAQPAEEEETLGQRRRRLQAEREAREREMGTGAAAGAGAGPAPAPTNGVPAGIRPGLDQRHSSLAHVLGNNNASRKVLSDPRADAERAKQEEAARFKREQDHKLAALRNQMPQNLSSPNLVRSGAYQAGQFNDGTGGTGLQRTSRVFSGPAAHASNPSRNSLAMQAGGMMGQGGVMAPGVMVQGGVMGNGYGMPGYNMAAPGYSAPAGYGAAYGMPQMAQVPLQMMPMPVQQPGQQYDRVDRWRQSILP